ncbi:MAG: hypothetical protein NT026_01185 [Candidatus Staskawiczbacteria bacterium]|nr:hypothetical protein [Candidatus Staskawiczbacteria bacterium]
MILLVHMLLGAAMGHVVKNPILAIIMAYLSHYLLDFIPHIEYDVKKLKKIILDLCLGILFIFLFSKNNPVIYICAFFAILPDGFTVLNNLFPNKILEIHNKLHTKKIHFLRDNKKISNFWRVFSQLLIIFISILLLTR